MKFFSASLAVLALASSTAAHHMITNILINGEEMPLGKCMRIPPTTSPVTDIYSDAMACNVGGNNGVQRVCEANAGDSISFMWRTWPDASQPGSLDSSHQGPCAVYLKKAPDGQSVTSLAASGGGWFKIFDDGYRDGSFCSQKIADNGGRMTVRLPTDLAAGEYLIRGEQIALHDAARVGGAQYYIGCAQIAISSAGQNTVPSTVAIPGHIDKNGPGVVFDYWNNKNPANYKTPGPAVFSPPANPGRINQRLSIQSSNCIAENANWCGKALPSFEGEKSCYTAAANCWNQVNECFSSAPATGDKGCKAFEKVCEKATAHCRSCGSSCSGRFP